MDLIKKINWLGLAGGVTTLAIVMISFTGASSWWQLAAGQGMIQANISPLSFNSSILGGSFTIPIILFLNLVSQLSLLASAISMLIYSIIPEKGYAKHLLGFAYKKPLIVVIIFLASILIATYFAGMLFNINVPLMGSATLTLSIGEASIEIPVETGFTWVFWLAITASALCLAARFYHKRIVSAPMPISNVTAPPAMASK